MSQQADTDPTIEELLAQLRSRDAAAREDARVQLSKLELDSSALGWLLEMLTDQSSQARFAALDVIWDQTNPLVFALEGEVEGLRSSRLLLLNLDATERLIVALSDIEADIRGLTAQLLGRLGDERAIEPLLHLYDRDERFKWHVVFALAEIASDDALTAIIQRFNDPDARIRWYIVEAIERNIKARQIKSEGIFNLLITALYDPSAGIRHTAAKSLGRLGDIRATEPLLKALIDEDADVRSAATRALGEFGDMQNFSTFIQLLKDKNKGFRRGAARALSLLGEPAFIPLLDLLKDGDPWVRIGAAMAVGYMRDARRLPALIVMQANDVGVTPTGATVKTAVSKAIKRITEKSEDD